MNLNVYYWSSQQSIQKNIPLSIPAPTSSDVFSISKPHKFITALKKIPNNNFSHLQATIHTVISSQPPHQKMIPCAFNYKQQPEAFANNSAANIMHITFLGRTRKMALIFVVPSIMLYSSEISPTRCNNCFFFSAMALLYMFRVTISPIIRSTYAVYGNR